MMPFHKICLVYKESNNSLSSPVMAFWQITFYTQGGKFIPVHYAKEQLLSKRKFYFKTTCQECIIGSFNFCFKGCMKDK